MAQVCDKPLEVNPFLTSRDPETGKWQVIQKGRAMATKECSGASDDDNQNG